MDINKFRADFILRLEEDKRSLSAVAAEYGVQQAALWRFKNGNQGLNAETLFALWPFVYGDTLAPPSIPPHAPQPSAPLP